MALPGASPAPVFLLPRGGVMTDLIGETGEPVFPWAPLFKGVGPLH